MEQPLVVPRIRMRNFQDEIIMSSGFDGGRLIFMTGAQRASPAPAPRRRGNVRSVIGLGGYQMMRCKITQSDVG